MTAVQLTTTCKDDVATIVVEGAVVVNNRALLAAQVDLALGYHPKRIVLDLAKLGQADSSGLGVIVGAAKKCRERSVALVVRGLNPDLTDLFRETKVDQIVTIEGSEAANG